jgi:hypothetical protein
MIHGVLKGEQMKLGQKNKVIWTGGEWNGGEWKGDIWEFGVFRKGTFSGKIWRNGIFKGGCFKGEIWEKGIWTGGIWMGLVWKRGYDSFGHLLEIPPDEWPEDQSLLCAQAQQFESYQHQQEGVCRFKIQNNLFFRQATLKETELKRIGVFLFHPDTAQNKLDMKQNEELFKHFMKLLECHDISGAEKMIARARATL